MRSSRRPSLALPPPDPPAPVRDEMAPNPASNPHISGPKGHIGAHMGLTGSIFSMQSNLVGRCFARNGPQDWGNPLFRGLWPILGLKMARSFQCAPLAGGTKGRKRKKIAKIALLSTQTNKTFSMFFNFFRVRNFFGPENGQVFSVRTAPIGGARGRRRKKIALFLTKTYFLKPHQK